MSVPISRAGPHVWASLDSVSIRRLPLSLLAPLVLKYIRHVLPVLMTKGRRSEM